MNLPSILEKAFDFHCRLPNYGNNCFVNATLQVLFAIPHFMNDLERASSRKDDLPENCVTILNEVAKARQNLSVENVNKHFRYCFNMIIFFLSWYIQHVFLYYRNPVVFGDH